MHTTASGGAIAAFLILISLATRAEQPEPDDDIIVTATRSAIPLSDAIVPVTVITRQDIEQSLASDLAELLRFEAGLDIARNGGPGQSTSVFMRGTESNHTLVLVDGVRINPGTVGGAAIQNIAPEVIERIEIVKGARSALFGTDAIGGVINIITRRNDRVFVEGGAGTGSFDTRSAYAAAGTRNDDADVGITLNWQDTEGFPSSTASDIDRGFENLSVNFYAGKRLGASYLTLRHWRAAGTTEYFDFFLAPLDQDFRNESTALELQTEVGENIDSKLVVSHIVDEISQNQSVDFAESARNALDWQLGLDRGNHRWIGGVYLVEENAGSFSFGSGIDEDTSVRAVFLEDQWSADRHAAFFAVRLTDHETFGNHTSWNAEYAFTLSETWTLNAGVGHAFRAPDATDRFGFGGNPDLDPEVADEAQIGLRFRPGARHSLELGLYRNDIEDLIEFDLASFELRNIAEAEIRGAELAWEYQGDTFSVRTALVKQSADNAADGSRLFRRAEESMTVSLRKSIGDHQFGLSVLASGDRVDVGNVPLPGYVLADLTAQFALGDHWHLGARIENLLDTTYETAAGFRMQERSAFVDLGFDWK
ncbi:MAG TPA: TonB-dependent receptor [Woeseiaceae bacterium]|nr:TonB-dependent receptor [Woeseiaceae bacterium]